MHKALFLPSADEFIAYRCISILIQKKEKNGLWHYNHGNYSLEETAHQGQLAENMV